MTYKKDSRLKEEIFLLSQIFLIVRYGIASEDNSRFEDFADQIEKVIKEEIQLYSNKSYEKWQGLIAKTNKQVGLLELYFEGKSSHKLVLILYQVMLQLKLDGYKIEQGIEDCMEKLLEIENIQEMDDEDWNKFKASADKQGRKILERLRSIGMFRIN